MAASEVVRFVISLREEAEDHADDYSIADDLWKIDGVENIGIGYAGLSATVDAPKRLFKLIEKAVPYAYVDIDMQADLL